MQCVHDAVMVRLDNCFIAGKYVGNICKVPCIMILVIFLGVEGLFAASMSSLNHGYCPKLATLKR